MLRATGGRDRRDRDSWLAGGWGCGDCRGRRDFIGLPSRTPRVRRTADNVGSQCTPAAACASFSGPARLRMLQVPERHALFIDNELVAPASGETLPVIDPSDGRAFAQIARGAAVDIDRAGRAARRAFDGTGTEPAAGPWGRTDAAQRGRLLRRWADLVDTHREALAALESRDTGKPLSQARADAQALARYFEFYAGAADKLHGETIPYRHGYTVLTLREPHGVTGHIIPWNYPMQIFGRSVGAALAAGNACVVKPAEDACLSLLRVAALAAEAGLPP